MGKDLLNAKYPNQNPKQHAKLLELRV